MNTKEPVSYGSRKRRSREMKDEMTAEVLERRRVTSAEWNQEHAEVARERVLAWNKQNAERHREYHRQYARARYRASAEYRVKKREAENLRRREIQREAILHYGGVCYCCGESRAAFLALDHINGGGSQHRRELKGSKRVCEWAKQNGWPPVLRVACHNCNIGGHINGGICPHQSEQLARGG